MRRALPSFRRRPPTRRCRIRPRRLKGRVDPLKWCAPNPPSAHAPKGQMGPPGQPPNWPYAARSPIHNVPRRRWVTLSGARTRTRPTPDAGPRSGCGGTRDQQRHPLAVPWRSKDTSIRSARPERQMNRWVGPPHSPEVRWRRDAVQGRVGGPGEVPLGKHVEHQPRLAEMPPGTRGATPVMHGAL